MYTKVHKFSWIKINKIHKHFIPTNKQTCPTVQTVTDNTIKHKHAL